MVRLTSLAIITLMVGALGSARAQSGNGPGENAAHREGEYQGVRPGESNARPTSTRYPRVTWVGFQPQADERSRFFVQLNQDTTVEQRLDDKSVLHVTVPGARFGSRNAMRRLDTRFFATPVATMTAHRAHRHRAHGNQPAQTAGVRFDFTFKSPEDAQQAQTSVQKKDDGYYYLFLDFGPPADAGRDANPAGSGGETP